MTNCFLSIASFILILIAFSGARGSNFLSITQLNTESEKSDKELVPDNNQSLNELTTSVNAIHLDTPTSTIANKLMETALNSHQESNDHLVETILNLLEMTKSPTILLLAPFFKENINTNQQERWSRALTWRKWPQYEFKLVTSSDCSVCRDFMTTIIKQASIQLHFEGTKGILQSNDYYLLMLCGMSDVVVDLLKDDERMNCPSIGELVKMARDYQEESFFLALYKNKNNINGLVDRLQSAEFWYAIAIIEMPSLFPSFSKHLRKKEVEELESMLNFIINNPKEMEKHKNISLYHNIVEKALEKNLFLKTSLGDSKN